MVNHMSYHEAYKAIHPQKDPETQGHSVHPRNAIKRLQRLGFPKAHYTNDRDLTRLKRDAIVCLRWSWAPNLGHAIVFDKRNKYFLDPSGTGEIFNIHSYTIKEYQYQINFIIYL